MYITQHMVWGSVYGGFFFLKKGVKINAIRGLKKWGLNKCPRRSKTRPEVKFWSSFDISTTLKFFSTLNLNYNGYNSGFIHNFEIIFKRGVWITTATTPDIITYYLNLLHNSPCPNVPYKNIRIHAFLHTEGVWINKIWLRLENLT